MVADPLTVLSRIATFAGLDPEDETWRQELAQISFPNKNAAWTADLPAEQQAALAPLADQLTAMGYR